MTSPKVPGMRAFCGGFEWYRSNWRRVSAASAASEGCAPAKPSIRHARWKGAKTPSVVPLPGRPIGASPAGRRTRSIRSTVDAGAPAASENRAMTGPLVAIPSVYRNPTPRRNNFMSSLRALFFGRCRRGRSSDVKSRLGRQGQTGRGPLPWRPFPLIGRPVFSEPAAQLLGADSKTPLI